MKTLSLACDFEEFNLPLDFGKNISENLMLEKAYEGIQRLLKLVKDHQIKMTFFATQKIAEAYSDLLKQLVAEGHEIGLHGCIDYKNNRDIEQTIDQIRYIKEEIEKNTKTKIYGFKNHKLVLLPSDIIRKAGFAYDNSCHPTYVPGRYCNFLKSRKINFKDDIINVPISVTPILRLPFSWIWFRNLGLNYAKFCTSWAFLAGDYVNIYFHSWDFADIDGKTNFNLPYSLTYNTGRKVLNILDNYLKWCNKNNYKLETIHNYLLGKKSADR